MEITENLSFEEALKALENIIKIIERGDCDIEKAVEYYEEASKLQAHCNKQLDAAREKIDFIKTRKTTENSDNAPSLETSNESSPESSPETNTDTNTEETSHESSAEKEGENCSN